MFVALFVLPVPSTPSCSRHYRNNCFLVLNLWFETFQLLFSECSASNRTDK